MSPIEILQFPKFEIPLQFLTRRSQPSALSFSPGKLRVSFVSSMQSRHLQVTEKQLNGCVSSANARMAESVDALVSNTSGAIRAGSIPAPGTRKWPTETCRPFLYKIFPTFSPHLTIILQKVFRFFCNFSTAHITPELRRIICLASSIRRV